MTSSRRSSSPMADRVAARFERSTRVPAAFFETQADRIAHACWRMARRFHRGGRLLALGNGARASDAQHVAVEFVHPVIVGKRALPALALTSDGPLLDGGGRSSLPGAPFSRQIALLGRPQDIALGFVMDAADGNIVEALETARSMGMLTLGLVGSEDGQTGLAALDFCFGVPGDDPTVVQEVHETLYHILWEVVHVFFEHEGLVQE